MLIALGVTGGIGAYKAVEVARGLQKLGHDVVAIMTHSATKFVGPITFEAITRRAVITDQFQTGMNADIEHIALATNDVERLRDFYELLGSAASPPATDPDTGVRSCVLDFYGVRLELVGKQISDAVGARILAGGYSYGEYDVSVIVEAPDDVTMAAVAIALAAGGAVRTAKTTPLLSGSQWVAALKTAPSVGAQYRPAR